MYQYPGLQYERFVKIAAAQRAIGIVNRLKPGPFRARHASRVFSNFNRLRAEQ